MGFFTRLFGTEGKVRFEATTYDGQSIKGKTTIEVIGCTWSEVEQKLKRALEFEIGQKVKTFKLTDFIET